MVTLSPPHLPEAATRNDDAGQEAFIRHWFDTYNYTHVTGDTEALLKISDPEVAGTKEVVRELKEIYEKGNRIDGNEYDIVDMVRVPPDEYGRTSATVTFTRRAGELVYRDGTREPLPAEPEQTYGMVLDYLDDRWVFFGLGTL